MFKYISTKLKDVLYLYPERTFRTIKTIRDNGTFGLFLYNPKIKDYVEIPQIDLINCNEAFITRTLQICNNIRTSSSSSVQNSSSSRSTSTSSSSSGEFVERHLYGWGSNDYNQITKSVLASISQNHLGKLLNGVPINPNLTISKIISGDNFNVALVQNNSTITGNDTQSWSYSVYAWGDNRYGQVSRFSDPTEDGTSASLTSTGVGYEQLIQSVTDTQFLKQPLIACGKNHTVIIYDNNSDILTKWFGNNNNGQLGEGKYTSSEQLPTKFLGSIDNILLTCGDYHTYVVDLNNDAGQEEIYFAGDKRYKQNEIPTSILQNLQGINQIQGGGYHTAVLMADGTVTCWGKNTNGQCLGTDENGNAKTSSVLGSRVTINGRAITNNIKIAAGKNHTCALNSFGVVVCWGDNSKGQCSVPTTLFDAVDIYAKGDTTVAIKRDGTLVMWGDTSNGKGNIPSYAKFTQGSVFSLGKDHCVMLANKTTQTIPETSPPLTHFNQYATDYFNNNIVRVYSTSITGKDFGLSIGTGQDNEIITYAPSDSGKLLYYYNDISGNNPNDTFYLTPNILNELDFNLAYKGGVLSPYVKIQNEMLVDVIQITSGDGFIVGLKSNGTVVAWGKNDLGQCDVPAALSTVKKIYSWNTGSFAIRQDGTIEHWGKSTGFDYPELLTRSNINDYSFGKNHLLILNKNGTITTLTKGSDSYRLKNPPKRGKFISIVSGYDHICALRENGTVVCWGNNSYNQCDVPTGLNNVIQITCGLYLSAALKSDGTVVGWGIAAASQYNGQNTNIIKISAGPDYILALKNDHTVTMWPNDSGDINNRKLTLPNIPTNIKTLTPGTGGGSAGTRNSESPDVVDISAGHNVACAILADTGMICWGKTFTTFDSEGVLCGRGGTNNPKYPWNLGDRVKTKVIKFSTPIYTNYPYLPVDGAFKVACEISDLGTGVSGQGTVDTFIGPPNISLPLEQQSQNYAGTVALLHGKVFTFGKLSAELIDPISGSPMTSWEKLQESFYYSTPSNTSTNGINHDITDVCFVNKRLWLLGKDYKVGCLSLNIADKGGLSDVNEPDFYLNGDKTNPNNKYSIFLRNIEIEQISAGRHHLIVVEKDTKKIYFFCHWRLNTAIKNSLTAIPSELLESPSELNNIVKIQAAGNNNAALSSNNKLYVWGEDTYFLHYFPEYFYIKDFALIPNKIIYLDFNDNIRFWGSKGSYTPAEWIDEPRIDDRTTIQTLYGNTGNMFYGYGLLSNYRSSDLYNRKLIPQFSAYNKLCSFKGSHWSNGREQYRYLLNSYGGPTKDESGAAGGACSENSTECFCCQERFPLGLPPVTTCNSTPINSDLNPNTTRQQLNSWYASRKNTSQQSEYIPFLLQRNTVYCLAGKVQKIINVKIPTTIAQSYIDKYVYHSPSENFFEDDTISNAVQQKDVEYNTVQNSDLGESLLNLRAVVIKSKDTNIQKTQLPATPNSGYSVSSSRTIISDYNDYNLNKHPFRRNFSFDGDPGIITGVYDENWRSELWNTLNTFTKKYLNIPNGGSKDYDQFYTQTIKYDVGWDDETALFLGLGNSTRNMNGTGGSIPFNNDLTLIGKPYVDEIVKCGTALWGIGYNTFGESFGIYPNGQPIPIIWTPSSDVMAGLYPYTQPTARGGRNYCCKPRLRDYLQDPVYTPQQNLNRTDDFRCVREISCGLRYSCIVDEFGRVRCWGRNDTNQCNVPSLIASSDSKRAIDVKCGPFHSCAMLKDGTVICWGNNKIDQLEVPSDLTGVVSIECGAFHTCALKSDGTVRCWGNNRDGQTDVPNSLKNVKQIACGYNHSIALRSDGKVVAWGANNFGQCMGTDSKQNIIQKSTANLGSTIKGNGLEISNIIKIFGSEDKTWLLRETGTNAAELLAFGLYGSGAYKRDELGSRILNGMSWSAKLSETIPTDIGNMYATTPTLFAKMTGCVASTPSTYPPCQLKTTLSKDTWINVITSKYSNYGSDSALTNGILNINDTIEIDQLVVNGTPSPMVPPIGFDNGPAQRNSICSSLGWKCNFECLQAGATPYPTQSNASSDVGICTITEANIKDIRTDSGIIQIKLSKNLHIPREIFETYNPTEIVITLKNKQTNSPIYLEVDLGRKKGRTEDAGLGMPYLIKGTPLLKYAGTGTDPAPEFIHVTKSGIVTWFKSYPTGDSPV